jgi:hypothetical protein
MKINLFYDNYINDQDQEENYDSPCTFKCKMIEGIAEKEDFDLYLV